MPFIQDLKGKTALHYCVENSDFKTADMMIQYLADAPLDHHSRQIIDIIPILIEQDIPSLSSYFDKRML